MSNKELRRSLPLRLQACGFLVLFEITSGIDSKDLSKKCSKKFACSCASIDADSAQIQGDVFEEVKELLTGDYKVKNKYILDKEKFN